MTCGFLPKVLPSSCLNMTPRLNVLHTNAASGGGGGYLGGGGGGGGGGGKKKEIEYWQITAKEVVKFRPCTETFIQRE